MPGYRGKVQRGRARSRLWNKFKGQKCIGSHCFHEDRFTKQNGGGANHIQRIRKGLVHQSNAGLTIDFGRESTGPYSNLQKYVQSNHVPLDRLAEEDLLRKARIEQEKESVHVDYHGAHLHFNLDRKPTVWNHREALNLHHDQQNESVSVYPDHILVMVTILIFMFAIICMIFTVSVGFGYKMGKLYADKHKKKDRIAAIQVDSLK
eukprot:289599_1